MMEVHHKLPSELVTKIEILETIMDTVASALFEDRNEFSPIAVFPSGRRVNAHEARAALNEIADMFGIESVSAIQNRLWVDHLKQVAEAS